MTDKYVKPKIDLVELDSESIIATSMALTEEGGDKPTEDLIISGIDIGDMFH